MPTIPPFSSPSLPVNYPKMMPKWIECKQEDWAVVFNHAAEGVMYLPELGSGLYSKLRKYIRFDVPDQSRPPCGSYILIDEHTRTSYLDRETPLSDLYLNAKCVIFTQSSGAPTKCNPVYKATVTAGVVTYTKILSPTVNLTTDFNYTPKWIRCEKELLPKLIEYLTKGGVYHTIQDNHNTTIYNLNQPMHLGMSEFDPQSIVVVHNEPGASGLRAFNNKPAPLYQCARCTVFVEPEEDPDSDMEYDENGNKDLTDYFLFKVNFGDKVLMKAYLLMGVIYFTDKPNAQKKTVQIALKPKQPVILDDSYLESVTKQISQDILKRVLELIYPCTEPNIDKDCDEYKKELSKFKQLAFGNCEPRSKVNKKVLHRFRNNDYRAYTRSDAMKVFMYITKYAVYIITPESVVKKVKNVDYNQFIGQEGETLLEGELNPQSSHFTPARPSFIILDAVSVKGKSIMDKTFDERLKIIGREVLAPLHGVDIYSNHLKICAKRFYQLSDVEDILKKLKKVNGKFICPERIKDPFPSNCIVFKGSNRNYSTKSGYEFEWKWQTDKLVSANGITSERLIRACKREKETDDVSLDFCECCTEEENLWQCTECKMVICMDSMCRDHHVSETECTNSINLISIEEVLARRELEEINEDIEEEEYDTVKCFKCWDKEDLYKCPKCKLHVCEKEDCKKYHTYSYPPCDHTLNSRGASSSSSSSKKRKTMDESESKLAQDRLYTALRERDNIIKELKENTEKLHKRIDTAFSEMEQIKKKQKIEETNREYFLYHLDGSVIKNHLKKGVKQIGNATIKKILKCNRFSMKTFTHKIEKTEKIALYNAGPFIGKKTAFNRGVNEIGGGYIFGTVMICDPDMVNQDEEEEEKEEEEPANQIKRCRFVVYSDDGTSSRIYLKKGEDTLKGTRVQKILESNNWVGRFMTDNNNKKRYVMYVDYQGKTPIKTQPNDRIKTRFNALVFGPAIVCSRDITVIRDEGLLEGEEENDDKQEKKPPAYMIYKEDGTIVKQWLEPGQTKLTVKNISTILKTPRWTGQTFKDDNGRSRYMTYIIYGKKPRGDLNKAIEKEFKQKFNGPVVVCDESIVESSDEEEEEEEDEEDEEETMKACPVDWDEEEEF